MADFSVLSPDGGTTELNVKDATARAGISTINGKIGTANGIASLDSNGKVPSSELPSYVDDVIEGYYKEADGKFYEESTYVTEITPEASKIYIDLSTMKEYRWGGSAYGQLNAGLALGETSGTAYEGSKGKANADAIAAIQDLIPSGAASTDQFALESDVSPKQNQTLAVPIEMLSGTKLTVESALNGLNTDKVDKVAGKDLSTNDYTDEDQTALQTTIPLEITQLQGSILGLQTDIDKKYGTDDTAETDLADTDYVPFYDASAEAKKKSLWSNIKAKLKTYFDTLYATFAGVEIEIKDTVGWIGKNLLPYPYGITSYSANGVTFTVNDDGSVTVNGTATADTPLRLFTGALQNGNYIISRGFTNALAGIRVEGWSGSTWVKTIVGASSFSSDEPTFTIDNDGYDTVRIDILIKSGAVLNNQKFYPMLRDASIVDDTYEPYHESVESVLETKGDWDCRNLLDYPNGTRQVVANDGTISDEPNMYLSDFIDVSDITSVIFSGTKTGGDAYIRLAQYDANKSFISRPTESNVPKTFIIDSNTKYVRCCFEDTVGGRFVNPMLQDASNATKDYTEHREPLDIAIPSKMSYADNSVLGAKNLYPTPKKTNANNGISYVADSDGVITANGTATATSFFDGANIITFPAGKYIISGCPIGGGDNSYRINADITPQGESSVTKFDVGNGIAIDMSKQFTVKLYPRIASGYTANNLVFKPMLRLASDPDSTYQPYSETNQELTKNKLSYKDNGILGAKNWFYPVKSDGGASVDISENGKVIRIYSDTAGTYRMAQFKMPVVPNTDYVLSFSADYTSGKGNVVVASSSSVDFKVFGNITADVENGILSFNSGNNTSIIIKVLCSSEISEVGDITFNEFLLTLASDEDRTWQPYAMTNRELTEMMTPIMGKVTGIVEGASVSSDIGNTLWKIGKVVYLSIGLEGLTATSMSTDIFTIPEGFRPPKNIFVAANGTNLRIASTTGVVRTTSNVSNIFMQVCASWITD